MGKMSRGQMCRFFFKHSCRDIGRRKFHFCLAFMSVFIVVISTLVIHTVVDKGPIIMMALAQEKVGAFDGYYDPRSDYAVDSVNLYSQTEYFINYTKVGEVLGDTYNLSPRFHICDVERAFADSEMGCLMAMDFERENEIGLSSHFPFESLGKGECLVSKSNQEKHDLIEGQDISFSFNEPNLWNTLLKYYFI